MIKALRIYVEEGKDPYRNLALERLLTESCPDGQCILYLWQNAKTVVIGRNQNAWKECRVTQLEQDGGHLARRLSGGGAVFHDDGNLNFTFIMPKDDSDVERQLEVIIEMCRAFGIPAERSGRNDVLSGGRKFSGNAFYDSRGKYYHHGTILINADTALMGRYLAPSKAKLEAKGVDSVRSRVVNLIELCPGITVDKVKKTMIEAFEKVYGCKADILDSSLFDKEKLEEYRSSFSSREWLYGHEAPFDSLVEKRFDWGEVSLYMRVEKGVVRSFLLRTDSMDWSLPQRAEELAVGCPVSELALKLKKQADRDPALADLSELIM